MSLSDLASAFRTKKMPDSSYLYYFQRNKTFLAVRSDSFFYMDVSNDRVVEYTEFLC
jgi:hypothetical protein